MVIDCHDAPPQGPEFKRKAVRSYVIRGGRATLAQERALHQYGPRYRVSLYDGVVNWAQVFGRSAPVVLEIGFGMGDSLLRMARAEPDKDFVGIEVHVPGAGRLLNNAVALELTNLRIYLADAVDVLADCIPDQSLLRVQLYFPDPWHKKKHHKRRLVQPNFVAKIRDKLQLGGIFHMATDWQPYAEHMADVMAEAPGFENTQGDSVFAPRPEFRPLTKFEQRGVHLGHGVWDLLYRRKG
ncbi:MAG: tRNA (guanosine(46)-N7)-methyltransferase TrmB [Porticoccaceae bacterium]